MDGLLNTAIDLYNKSNSSFKERYAYQAIRLAHYSKQYIKTLNLFDKYFGKQKQEA